MAENLDTLKRELQGFFTDGMVVVIGSGLSVAEGLPSMGAIATALLSEVDGILGKKCPAWDKIADCLRNNMGLEEALLKTPPSSELSEAIEDIVTRLVLQAEQKTIEEVVSGNKQLKLQSLLPRIIMPAQGLPIITTNYDRLVELAAESNGYLVDGMFVGDIFARFDPQKSRQFLRTEVNRGIKKARSRYLPHVRICKPHGSLDWFLDFSTSEPIRSLFNIVSPRLIVTPGAHKYRSGYNKPFDAHREAANSHIDQASRLLIIGYGFNDDHLETHLSHQIKAGVPTLILTYELSDNAKTLVEDCENVTAICSDGNKNPGTIVQHRGEKVVINGFDWWDIEIFCKEIFGQ